MSLREKNAPSAPSDPLPVSETARPFSLWRVLLIGALLIPINVFWITVIEVRWFTLDGTSLPLFITPIFLLFVLAVTNLGWRKMRGKSVGGLRQEELLLVYAMLVVSCTFAGHDTMQNMFGSIGHPYWYASPDNKWQSLFFRFLPNWLLVTDKDALTGYYHGNVSIYSPEGRHFLTAWYVPLFAWGAFFMTLVVMYLCLTLLVRKSWIEQERLTFPLVQLPLAMTADDAGKSFFKSPQMWAGFAIAFLVSGLNGMHTLFPNLPELNVKLYPVDQLFKTPPWNSMGSTQSSFYPFAVGIGYFMPLDLSFSCWFFFIAARLFRVLGSVYGWGAQNNGFPYFGEQAAGGWIGLGIMLVYSGRHYWKNVFLSAWAGKRADDPAEARVYRAALIGLVAGGLLLAVFSRMIGLSAWVAAAFFGIMFLLGFVITRVRAEFGAPHEIVWVNPEQLLITVFGTQALGVQNLTGLSVMYWFNRGYRNHPMPNQLEAFKMFEGKPAVRTGTLVGALALASAISIVCVYWANLHVTYAAGAGAKAAGFKWWVGAESYDRLADWISHPKPPASTGLYYIAGGMGIAVILAVLRSEFAWWPFHPAGYALSLSYAMEYFWMPVMIAWLLKFLIIRYGGVRLYRLAVPFFLGLILGDYTMGSIWALVGPLLGVPTYKIYI